MKSKLLYWLCAIYYRQVKFETNISKIFRDCLNWIIIGYIALLPPGKYKRKVQSNLPKSKAIQDYIWYDLENGISTNSSKMMMYFCLFCYCYIISVPISTLIFVALTFDLKMIICALCLMSVYFSLIAWIDKNLFKADYYIEQFKQFDTNGMEWQKKWKLIHILFAGCAIPCLFLANIIAFYIIISLS